MERFIAISSDGARRLRGRRELKRMRFLELLPRSPGGVRRAGARQLAVALPYEVGKWPWATFLVNIVGAFALGYLSTRLPERLPVSAYRRPLLGTGFCGALTTFSTMQLELLRMLGRRRALRSPSPTRLLSIAAGFTGGVAFATRRRVDRDGACR